MIELSEVEKLNNSNKDSFKKIETEYLRNLSELAFNEKNMIESLKNIMLTSEKSDLLNIDPSANMIAIMNMQKYMKDLGISKENIDSIIPKMMNQATIVQEKSSNLNKLNTNIRNKIQENNKSRNKAENEYNKIIDKIKNNFLTSKTYEAYKDESELERTSNNYISIILGVFALVLLTITIKRF